MISELRKEKLIQELKFSSSRSSGPGGQNVNKVNTKIELRFTLENSLVLNEFEKEIIKNRLNHRITQNGDLIITVQSSRSQLKNKEEAIFKFFWLIDKALTPIKKRKKTNPTRASIKKRLENKKMLSSKKSMRKKPPL